MVGLAIILLLGTATGLLRIDIDRGTPGHCGHDTWDVSPGVALRGSDDQVMREFRLHDTCAYPH